MLDDRPAGEEGGTEITTGPRMPQGRVIDRGEPEPVRDPMGGIGVGFLERQEIGAREPGLVRRHREGALEARREPEIEGRDAEREVRGPGRPQPFGAARWFHHVGERWAQRRTSGSARKLPDRNSLPSGTVVI